MTRFAVRTDSAQQEQNNKMEISDLYQIFLKCTSITTDTRKIKGGELFIALKGENFDGNDYVLKAIDLGASYAVIDCHSVSAKKLSAESKISRKIIFVENTYETLKKLAIYHRNAVLPNGKRLPIIALTGTNGKTTTKELIKVVLSKNYKITATQGNLNNDIGVPLTLLSITQDTQIAIVEMGANHLDDIKKLVNICQPDYGLITNVGKAHLLGFGSFEGVKKAKGELYCYIAENNGVVFLNDDDSILKEMLSGYPALSIRKYGINYDKVIICSPTEDNPYLSLEVNSANKTIYCNTHLIGDYNTNNVLAAISIGKFFGVQIEDAIEAISSYIPDNNRSQMVKTEYNTLIVDAYNANPSSMYAALENFQKIQSNNKIIMIGDMRELGTNSIEEHKMILRKALNINASKIYLVGEEFKKSSQAFGKLPENCYLFDDSKSLSMYIKTNPIKNATILIKGSRGITMETVIPQL